MTNKDAALLWLDKAVDDLAAAHHLMKLHPLRVEIICFHAQQAAEKALKATLAYNDITPEKTHALGGIVEKVKEFMPEMEDLKGKAMFLNPYAVEFRYPNEESIEDDVAEYAVLYAEEILRTSEKHINSDAAIVVKTVEEPTKEISSGSGSPTLEEEARDMRDASRELDGGAVDAGRDTQEH